MGFRPPAVEIFAHPPASAAMRLLAEAGLPTADLAGAHMENFFACGSVTEPEGIVGLELYGPVALLRSLAVSSKRRGQGRGTALVAQAERFAQSRGAETIYLLTDTAARFFERLGYARVARDSAPEAIRRTQEFSTLCSSSSTLMAKQLPAGPATERDARKSGARPSS